MNFKTEMCSSYLLGVPCKFGVKCTFAHNKKELKTRANSDNFKTKKCANFHGEGYCKYGNRCQYIHFDIEEASDNLAKQLLSKGMTVLAFSERKHSKLFDMFAQGKDCLKYYSTDEEV